MCSTEPVFAATRWSALGKLSWCAQDRRGGCLQGRPPDSVARRSRMRVEPSQIVEHRNKRRPREVSFGKRSHQEPRHVRFRFDGAARARARRLCRAGTDFNFSRRHPRPCGSPHVVRPRIRDRGRDRHQCARVHLFCSGLRVRVRVSLMRARARHIGCRAAAFAAVAFTRRSRLHRLSAGRRCTSVNR